MSQLIDSVDKQLLALLQQNAKQTTKALADQLHLSKTAVYERIRKLEVKGVIKKYTALLDPAKTDLASVVFCHVKLTKHVKEQLHEFEAQVLALKEVVECYHVSGDYDYMLKVHVRDMPSYREFMTTKLTTLKHIGSTHSVFMIAEVKNTTELTL